jgi:phosphoribosylanthranilate isomerase
MWIKICANTTLRDALRAAESGADAVGFVFAPSSRQVSPHQVGAITTELPYDLTQIGVFVTHDFEEITATVRTAGLHGIQIHGGLDLPLLEKLRCECGHDYFLIQTLHWEVDTDPDASAQHLLAEYRAVARKGLVDAVLIDAKTATASGGTGRTVNWTLIHEVLFPEAMPAAAGGPRIILAGGLTPENVAEAITTLRPWGVDVASGVEERPGKKDSARVNAFIRNARTAFAEIEKPRTPFPVQP